MWLQLSGCFKQQIHATRGSGFILNKISEMALREVDKTASRTYSVFIRIHLTKFHLREMQLIQTEAVFIDSKGSYIEDLAPLNLGSGVKSYIAADVRRLEKVRQFWFNNYGLRKRRTTKFWGLRRHASNQYILVFIPLVHDIIFITSITSSKTNPILIPCLVDWKHFFFQLKSRWT